MVLGKAASSERLAARSLEIEAGRVHEHEIERAEQIAPPREQFLLDDVLQATRREGRRAVLLIFGQFLAEPGHRPIEVMQVEVLDAIDPVILPPAVRRPIGAAAKQAMQNGEKHRAFEREVMLARTGEVLDRPSGNRSPPTIVRRRARARCVAPRSPLHRRRRRRRRQWPSRRSARPIAATAPIARSRANPRRGQAWRSPAGAPRAFATAFDDLQIGAAARGLLAEIHVVEPIAATQPRCAHDSQDAHVKSSKISKHVALHFRGNCSLNPTISMAYRRRLAATVED